MIAIDTNILIYAFRSDSPHHSQANRRLNEVIGHGPRVAVPWPCVHEFLSVVSNPRMPNPAPPGAGLAAMEVLLNASRVEAIGEAPGHLELLSTLMTAGGVRGPKVHDARIAAICLGHGVDELWTADRDFSSFPSLRTRNPLVS